MPQTRNLQGVYVGLPIEKACETASYPPAFLEYMWYASLCYAMLGQVWGIVIPSVGGAILLLLAAACFLNVVGQTLRVYEPVALALCTGTFLIAIGFIFHEWTEQAWYEAVTFVGWL